LLACIRAQQLIERPTLGAGGRDAGTMRPSLAAGRVPLHAAGVRRSEDLATLTLHGADATERPRIRDSHLMAAATEVLDRVLAETRLDRQRARREAPGVERRDEVIGVPLRRVDRRLQVEPAGDVPEERMQRPPLLLVAAPRATRAPRP